MGFGWYDTGMITALPYVLIQYAIWHYTEAIRELLLIWRNILWFFWNLFSVPLLLGTLFSPFRRIHERVGSHGLNLEDIGGAIAVNLIMRLVGFVLRLMVITIGLTCIAVTLVTGVASIAVWVLMPLIIPGLISGGVAALFM